MDQEEIFAHPAIDEQCVSGVYKDLSEFNHKNTNNLVKKRDRTQKFSKRHEGWVAPAASGGCRLTPEEGVNHTSVGGVSGKGRKLLDTSTPETGAGKGTPPGPRAQHPEMPSPGPPRASCLALPGRTQQLAPDVHAPSCAHHLSLGDRVPQGSLPWWPPCARHCHRLPSSRVVFSVRPLPGCISTKQAWPSGAGRGRGLVEQDPTHRVQKLIVQLHAAQLSDPKECRVW